MTHIERMIVRWWQTGIECEAEDCRIWGQISDWFHGAKCALMGFEGDDFYTMEFLEHLAFQRQRDLYARRVAA